jgi:methionine-rich copper-binding protein CopC
MRRTQIKILGALAFAAAVAMAIPAIQAFAHAAYDHSTPAKDEVVPTPPAQVDAYFKQNIFRQTGEYYFRVYADDDTTQVSPGDGTIDDNNRKHMFTTMPASMPNGRYIVHWKTKSDADGDVDSGMYCFYIGVQPTAAQQAKCASFAPTPVPTISSTAQATSAGTQSAATRTATPSTNNSGGGSSNTGLIVGVVAGVIVVVIVAGGAGLWWRSRQA